MLLIERNIYIFKYYHHVDEDDFITYTLLI